MFMVTLLRRDQVGFGAGLETTFPATGIDIAGIPVVAVPEAGMGTDGSRGRTFSLILFKGTLVWLEFSLAKVEKQLGWVGVVLSSLRTARFDFCSF